MFQGQLNGHYYGLVIKKLKIITNNLINTHVTNDFEDFFHHVWFGHHSENIHNSIFVTQIPDSYHQHPEKYLI